MVKIRKIISILLALLSVVNFTACNSSNESKKSSETKTFTDSLDREIQVPQNINKVAVTGSLAQIALFALCPDKLVGISLKWDELAKNYIDEKYYNLPVLGKIYGGKGDLNLETLINSGAEVVVDVGEVKKDKEKMSNDLDSLQQQTGIPFIHIDSQLDSMGSTYRELGKLFNLTSESEVLAQYCDDTYKKFSDLSRSINKVDLLFVCMDGQNVLAKNSYPAQVVDLLSNNLAVLDSPSSKGSGNKVSMEQIINWNPSYIIVDPSYTKNSLKDDPAYANVKAVKENKCYKAPSSPYNWLTSPPSSQRYMGMLWLAKTLYPDNTDYDLYDEIRKHFKLFYHCDLSKEVYDKIMSQTIM